MQELRLVYPTSRLMLHTLQCINLELCSLQTNKDPVPVSAVVLNEHSGLLAYGDQEGKVLYSKLARVLSGVFEKIAAVFVFQGTSIKPLTTWCFHRCIFINSVLKRKRCHARS